MALYRGGNDCCHPQGKLGSVVFPQEISAIISLEDREKQKQRQQKVGEEEGCLETGPQAFTWGIVVFFSLQ